MSDYLDFSGDDGDYLLDAFVDGGFPAIEPLVWGDGSAEAGAVDDALAMDGIFGPPDSLADPNNTATTGVGSESSLLKSVEGWLKQNPNLAKLGLSGVAGLAGAYSANKSGQSSMETLKEQEAQKLRTRQRVGDSIIAMAPFQVKGAQPLQRLDGSRVFGQDGKIMR